MPVTRKIAVAVFGLRIAYGAGLVALPLRLTGSWLGPAASSPPTHVPVRGLGAREVVRSPRATLLVAGGSALVSAALAAVVDA